MPKAIQITDEQFLAAWVECGYDSKKAYKKLKPNISIHSHATLGARKLAKCKSSEVYKSLLDKAYKTLATCMEAKNENVKLQSAKDLLDRVNGKAKETLKVEGEIKFNIVNYGRNDTPQLHS